MIRAILFGFIGCFGGLITAFAASSPNVLFIAVDDLRPELGCYGATSLKTPNIDRLAAGGVQFNNHYVQVATCGSSRYALLTGRSPFRSRAMGNGSFNMIPKKQQTGARSMPELFRMNGYHTVCIGKISHAPDGRVFAYNGKGDGRMEVPGAWDELPTPFGQWKRGWGTFFAYADGKHREDGSGFRPLMQFTAEKDTDLPDGMMTETAIEHLSALAKSDKPFFMGLGFYKPHLPFVATKGDWEASADSANKPEVSEKLDNKWARTSGEILGYHSEFRKDRVGRAPEVRRAYRACVRYVDRQVGKVLDALDKHGFADNTIVVLWGDHGWDLGEQQLWGKHKPLERANRSPLLIRGPGIKAGLAIDTPVETIDVYPSLIEVCGLRKTQTHHELDGNSLKAVVTAGQAVERQHAISFWSNCVSIRHGDYRLLTTHDKQRTKLTPTHLYRIQDGGEAGGPNLLKSKPEVAQKILAIANKRLLAP